MRLTLGLDSRTRITLLLDDLRVAISDDATSPAGVWRSSISSDQGFAVVRKDVGVRRRSPPDLELEAGGRVQLDADALAVLQPTTEPDDISEGRARLDRFEDEKVGFLSANGDFHDLLRATGADVADVLNRQVDRLGLLTAHRAQGEEQFNRDEVRTGSDVGRRPAARGLLPSQAERAGLQRDGPVNKVPIASHAVDRELVVAGSNRRKPPLAGNHTEVAAGFPIVCPVQAPV